MLNSCVVVWSFVIVRDRVYQVVFNINDTALWFFAETSRQFLEQGTCVRGVAVS
jgi:hypothetical protein